MELSDTQAARVVADIQADDAVAMQGIDPVVALRWLLRQADSVLSNPALTPREVAILMLLQRLTRIVATMDERMRDDGK